MSTPSLPPGAHLLNPDEAIELITLNNHVDAEKGSIALDLVLIEALRAGTMLACQMPDGRLAFTPTGGQS